MIGLLFKLCIVVTPSNIISKFKHYKGIVIAILFEPEDPLDMTTAPLSPSIAMPVLNDKPPPTPAKPALAVERLAAPESDRLRANATFNCYIAAQGNFSTASIHSDRSASTSSRLVSGFQSERSTSSRA